jgi:predicted permease
MVLLQELRFAARNLRRSPTFTTVAVLSLAFGIGVNAAIFTLVDGILLEKLPVANPQSIVQVHAHYRTFENNSFNVPVLHELERQDSIFAQLGGFYSNPLRADLGAGTQSVRAQFVTGGFFRLFDTRPVLGRLLNDEDARTEGAHPVCVLTFDAWQNYFGGDTGVLHRTVRAREIELQIVGVAPAGFVDGELQGRYDLYLPISESNALAGIPMDSANYIYLDILGRLKPGLALPAASARLSAVSAAIEEALPKDHANSGNVGFDSWRSQLHDPLMVLMGAVSLVLLVACANLANLLLARAASRRQEFAIKLAIGISRWGLMRQLLVETAIVAALGGALALAGGAALTDYILSLFNSSSYSALHVSQNGAVLWFTFGACLLTILLAGLYPAWKASHIDAARGLQASSLSGRHGLVRRALIPVQVALAVVLLFGASLFSHSLRNLKTIDLGYRIDHVLTVQLGMRGSLKNAEGVLGAPELQEVLLRAKELPGVESAALSNPGMLTGAYVKSTIKLADGDSAGRKISNATTISAGPNFFATLRLPMLLGRDFAKTDGPNSTPVAIVNRRFASQAWPGQNALGKHLDGGVEVIGVVADSLDHGIRATAEPIVYTAFDQAKIRSASLELRCAASLPAIEAAVTQIVKRGAPSYEITRSASLELMRDRQIGQERLLAFLSTLFGVLGTTLALVGIYGLIAYSVTRRTREIGIRISVGAQDRDVLWLFLREASLLLTAGVAAGLPLALLLSRFVGKLLYQVPALDALSVAATIALIAVGGVAAALIPARRASRVDPLSALRSE